jgi:hypothetical protein
MDALLIPVIILAILFIGAASFAVWAFTGRQDYKNNVDAKISQAVATNTKTVQAQDAKDYAEASKNPLKTYAGPDAYGSVKVSYPKTWSAYIDTTDEGTPLNAYFHSDVVPSTQDQSATYNLRVQVVAQAYDDVLEGYTSQMQGENSGITAVPYTLPKVPGVMGTRLSGKIFSDKQNLTGDIILLPVRDKSLEIWIESNAYLADFNKYILPNLTFSR